MPRKKPARMCLACHWRKFRRTALGVHPSTHTGPDPDKPCPKCGIKVPFIYECDCQPTTKGAKR